MASITNVHIDARPEVWGDALEFINAPERGAGPRSKVIMGKPHDPEELIPEGMRKDLHHREYRHIQDHTTPGVEYQVHWIHGQFVDAGHARSTKRYSHYESWFLIVDDTGSFLDVPAALCSPSGKSGA